MTDAPTAGGGRIGPVRDRWLVLGAVAVFVFAVAVGGLAVVGNRASATPSPAASSATGLSPVDEALRGSTPTGRIRRRPRWPSSRPRSARLPGVPTPRTRYVISLRYARDPHGRGPLVGAVRRAGKADPRLRRPGRQPQPCRPPSSRRRAFDTYQSIADRDAADIGGPLRARARHPDPRRPRREGRPRRRLGVGQQQLQRGPRPASPATACTVTVPPSTANDRSRDQFMRWVLLHEVWHCFQYTLVERTALKQPRPGCRKARPAGSPRRSPVVPGRTATGIRPLAALRQRIPGKPLYARVYDAVGFYAQLGHNGIDPWKVIQGMISRGRQRRRRSRPPAPTPPPSPTAGAPAGSATPSPRPTGR